MFKKIFNILLAAASIYFSIFSFSILSSDSNSIEYFSIIFSFIGLALIFLAINMLNNHKKYLSFFSFVLASFFFILVGSSMVINI